MDSRHIRNPHDRVAKFCRENGIAGLARFGSILRDDFRPDRRRDMLVEFPSPVCALVIMAIARIGARVVCHPGPQGRPAHGRRAACLVRNQVLAEALPSMSLA